MFQISLAGKNAVVTGSTSGIGLGIARAFAQAGANVLFNGLESPEQARELTDKIAQEFGVRTAYGAANLMRQEGVEDLIGQAEAAFGHVDILVNNAGMQHVAAIEEFPEDKFLGIQNLNYFAVFHGARRVFKGMKERKFGRIINIASAHGLVASEGKSAYVGAKHAILGLTKTIALEGALHGITANSICPGYVWTPLVEKQIPDQAKLHNMSEEDVIQKVLLYKQPTKKFATVEEIGALAVLLASDLAASITGTAIPVDGGWTAQ